MAKKKRHIRQNWQSGAARRRRRLEADDIFGLI